MKNINDKILALNVILICCSIYVEAENETPKYTKVLIWGPHYRYFINYNNEDQDDPNQVFVDSIEQLLKYSKYSLFNSNEYYNNACSAQELEQALSSGIDLVMVTN